LKRRLAGLRPSELHPIYFAMVMGTGTLSTGAALLGRPALSLALFGIALAAFALLLVLVLSLVRFARYPDRVRADMRNPKTAFAPYTFVAALAVLANRATFEGAIAAPAVALVIGLVGADVLAVSTLRMVQTHTGRPEVATGNWQLPSVAIAALALLATSLALRSPAPALVWVARVSWVLGIVAYVAVLPALVRRFRCARFGPADLTPDDWTPMAVPSLIGLAAAQLWSLANSTERETWLGYVFETAAFGGLAISAVLAPIWIVLQAWQLVRDESARCYSPAWWGLVFPTAIVVVAAEVLASTFHAPWLHTPALVGYACVFAAWIVISEGLIRDSVRWQGSTDSRPRHCIVAQAEVVNERSFSEKDR
jgi:tellurite resistance protein TehA-like permease